MQAERTSYAVDGWGQGELWTTRDVVLAHHFDFRSVSDTKILAGDVPAGADMGDESSTAPSNARRNRDLGCGAIESDLAPLPLDRDRCLTPAAPAELIECFRAFLAGKEVTLADVPLELDSSSPFQHAVATALRAVPRGEVVTYAELAALAGHPGAQRAVGTFCARNRFMFLLPCHRVVGAEGIGGYGSSGVAVKRRLLALEGVVL